MSDDISLILPGQRVPDAASPASLPPAEAIWLRNPQTGVIYKFHTGDGAQARDNDSIARCLKDGYTRSSEAAAREQAIELARLQGRPLPEWATEAAAEKTPAKSGK